MFHSQTFSVVLFVQPYSNDLGIVEVRILFIDFTRICFGLSFLNILMIMITYFIIFDLKYHILGQGLVSSIHFFNTRCSKTSSDKAFKIYIFLGLGIVHCYWISSNYFYSTLNLCNMLISKVGGKPTNQRVWWHWPIRRHQKRIMYLATHWWLQVQCPLWSWCNCSHRNSSTSI